MTTVTTGVIHHMALACQDPIAIERYYTEHFGFRRARVIPLGDTPEAGQIVFIRLGDAYLELFQAKEPRPQERSRGDGPWYPEWRHIAFKVEDVDAKLAEMGEAAVVTLGPFSFDAFIPGWRTVWLADPEGNVVEVSQGYVDQENPPEFVPAQAPAEREHVKA